MAANGVVVRTLFRALCKAAAEFDQNLALRALITAVPQRLYHRGLNRVVSIDSSPIANEILERVVRDMNGGADFYRPRRRKQPHLAKETLRQWFKQPPVPLPAAASAGLDAGFEALRWFDSVRSSYSHLPIADWRPVRVPRFELAEDQSRLPRVGDVLLTHPIACLRQPMLHQAAILLAEGGEVGFGSEPLSATARATAGPATQTRGIIGVVLNRPTRLTLDQLLAASQDETNLLLAPFRGNVVYVGGDVMRDRMLMLHPFPDVADAARVCDGVFMSSDLHAIHDAIVRGCDPARFKIFVGHCGWAQEQLQLECDRGIWFTARGSSPRAVAHVAVDTHCFLDEECADGLAPIVCADGAKAAQHLLEADRSLYCAILSSFDSEEHTALTQLACDADVLLELLHAIVERHLDKLHDALAKLE
jgi:putative AlgH/UPF0301 family transcriptional regulator